MRTLLSLAVAFAAFTSTTEVHAIERYHSSTLKFVYPLASGDFVIGFDVDSAQCPSAGSPKYFYVAVNQNGVAAEGAKKLYAAALMTFTTRQSVYMAFDDSTAYCYINRFSVQD